MKAWALPSGNEKRPGPWWDGPLLKILWDKAEPQERADIVAALFGKVRVRDKTIVSATLADQRYAPLIASSEARRLRLVKPADDGSERVGLAPPDGLKPPSATHTSTTTSRSGEAA
ncbi:MAG: hypothetical protein R6W93_13465 [Candidatus Limnocylindrales bacterium]